MNTEDKQLLLKALCAGLPYHLRIHICNDSWEGCRKGEFDNMMGFHHVEAFLCDRIEILPYLRPMSSMTEKEENELVKAAVIGGYNNSVFNSFIVVDWLNAHHFDFRNLIEKGLALEAPKGIYEI